jgi:hypothetical protein
MYILYDIFDYVNICKNILLGIAHNVSAVYDGLEGQNVAEQRRGHRGAAK